MHVHRTGDGLGLQCAFALTRGGGRYETLTIGGCADLPDFRATYRPYADVVWSSPFPDEAS